MTRAVLAFGSNMGDSERYLTDAVRDLKPALRAVSSLYRTPPWGPVAQDDFLNLVAIASDPAIDAAGWWQWAQRLETAARRERPIRWGPRTLDVDVIAVWEPDSGGDGARPVLSGDPELTLPHPRAHQRGFVLLPWVEIDPDAVLPGYGRIADLLSGVDLAGIDKVGTVAWA